MWECYYEGHIICPARGFWGWEAFPATPESRPGFLQKASTTPVASAEFDSFPGTWSAEQSDARRAFAAWLKSQAVAV